MPYYRLIGTSVNPEYIFRHKDRVERKLRKALADGWPDARVITIPTQPKRGSAKYSKGAVKNNEVTSADAQILIANSKSAKERALLAFLFLIGPRPKEAGMFCNGDITKDDPKPGYVTFRVFTAKLQKAKNILTTYRHLQLPAGNEFVKMVVDLHDLTPLGEPLFPWSPASIRKIVYKVCKGTSKSYCPYTFRHSRLLRLAKSGASFQALMSWKGARDPASVKPYMDITPVGENLVIN